MTVRTWTSPEEARQGAPMAHEPTEVRKLYVLLCGYEILRKSDSTRGRDSRFVIAVPISAYLIETTDGYMLVDTGVNSQILNTPALREQYYTGRGWTPPIVLPEHELLFQLAQIGVRPEDVGHVVLTHMHMDHTGNLKHFRHARISLQRREHDYAFSAHHSPAWFDIDYEDPSLCWDLHDGDWPVLPGIDALATYGHTPGHQSLVVRLPAGGSVVLVGDVGDLAENFADEVLPGEASDDEEALSSIRRVNRVAAEQKARLFLTHDPDFVRQARLAPEFYD